MIIKGGAGPHEAAAIAAVIAILNEEAISPPMIRRPESSSWVAAVRPSQSRLRPTPPPPKAQAEDLPSRFVDPV